MKLRKHAIVSFLGLALTASPAVAAGQSDALLLGTPAPVFINGGVGEEEAEAMRQHARDFPLRVILAAGPRNEFTAYVPVVITDASGNPVLEVPDAGPLLYVKLPPGTYTVTARSEGITKSQRVSLARGHGRDVVFHWHADAGP